MRKGGLGLQEQDILEKLIPNDHLFNYIHVINQKFDIEPKDKEHYGLFIEYQDIKELRKDFLAALEDTIVDWVYSQEKFERIEREAIADGRSKNAASSYVLRRAKEKFRANRNTNQLMIQGQLGELLLFHCIQRFMKAVPILRKMPITTSNKHERYGADAIHYKVERDKNIIILGEAKAYSAEKRFNTAFSNALNSILDTYDKHRDEIESYVHEDFLDDDLNMVAEKYINNTLESVEVHLVSIIIYNEDQVINITDEMDIKRQIKDIVRERYKNYDNKKIDINKNRILSRITYIVFPIWKLEELARDFQNRL